MLVDCFIPENMSFFLKKNFIQVKVGFYRKKLISLGIKQSTSVLVQTLRKLFWQNFAANFLLFFSFFAQKMLKITFLTSVWSKYTTSGDFSQDLIFQLIIFFCKTNSLVSNIQFKSGSSGRTYLFLFYFYFFIFYFLHLSSYLALTI